MFVSPFRNHSNSWMIERKCSFFVVSTGKVSPTGNRACAPKTDSVPVPVRSPLARPSLKTSRNKSRY